MRFVFPFLFLLLVIVTAGTWIGPLMNADPKAEALTFLQIVQSGDVVKAVKQFGSNRCRCPAKGGWVSYLIYTSGQEPNLAFLLGHPFNVSKAPHVMPLINNRQTLIPWERPQDCYVDIPISFDNRYMPFFLPLKMAYGQTMTQKEFEDFLKDPDIDAWKGFTLRLRASLESGAINPPHVDIPSDMVSDFAALTTSLEKLHYMTSPDDTPNKAPTTQEKPNLDLTEVDIKKTLGKEATAFIHPMDPNDVLSNDNAKMSKVEIASHLPRLKSAILRLHVVRRGQLQDWTIYHFAFMDPILELADGRELKLTHNERPK